MKVKCIYGYEAPALNVLQQIKCGPSAGVVCLGGARKRYGNSSVNEDALFLAHSSTGTLIAVADAHNGPEASQLTIKWLEEKYASDWLSCSFNDDTWKSEAQTCFERLNAFILETCCSLDISSRTTLVLALVQEEIGRVFIASAGDSHAFLVKQGSVSEHATTPSAGDFFLGQQPQSRHMIESSCAFCSIPVMRGDSVILASDGISTEGIGFPCPVDTLQILVKTWSGNKEEMSPEKVARATALATCEIQQKNDSGDNIAIAVACAEGFKPSP